MPTKDSDPPPRPVRHYFRPDLDLPDDELEAQIEAWLDLVLKPPPD